MARLFKADGGITEIQPKDGQSFTLDEMQELVGGYIEVVAAAGGYSLVIDEEGRVKGKPFNELATAAHAIGRPLVGDALLVTIEHPGSDNERFF
jgi:hypothetical protein